MAKQPKSKPRRQTHPRRFQLPLADTAELKRREERVRELELLGHDLDTVLRRIGSYLAWIHRDVLRLKTHVTNLEVGNGKNTGNAGNHD